MGFYLEGTNGRIVKGKIHQVQSDYEEKYKEIPWQVFHVRPVLDMCLKRTERDCGFQQRGSQGHIEQIFINASLKRQARIASWPFLGRMLGEIFKK